MVVYRTLLCALALLPIVACGARVDPLALPTARINLVGSAPAPTAVTSPAPASERASPTPFASPASFASPHDQYRAWMQQARQAHPYAEPLEAMWAVMICESSARADVVAGENYGLFQYTLATWSGEWNPYREQPILDPRAQIFATAKAWHDGNQAWWGCYGLQ